MYQVFTDMLKYIVMNKYSDLHLQCDSKPFGRQSGVIKPLSEFDIVSPETMKNIIDEIINGNEKKRDELLDKKQLDISYSIGDQRFRVNIFTQKGNYGVVIRVINSKIPSLVDLGLPPVIDELPKFNSGLVLITGPTGSGKSTTLASIIDIINSTERTHILTIEDPIEYVHRNKMSIVNQREVGQDVDNFNDAVKASLREDPDIVLVGEMRDLETISNAITIAETGHLVFGTLHTMSAPQTVNRMIDVFPPEQQQQIRVQLSSVIKAVVCQKLIPGIDGKYRCAAEVMLVNDAIRGIVREGRNISSITDQISMNKKKIGTQTLDQALASLYNRKQITLDVALEYSNDKENLKKLIDAGVV